YRYSTQSVEEHKAELFSLVILKKPAMGDRCRAIRRLTLRVAGEPPAPTDRKKLSAISAIGPGLAH
ncbi:MAG: hypothetical protein WAM05_07000, partial [Candidatus Binataceae bacterium]